MADEPDPERLRALDARLSQVKGAKTKASDAGTDFSQGEQAWRMVIELVSGMVLGLGIGYGLDWLFDTLPIFLLVFGLLGFIAGIKTMMGTARDMAEKQAKAQGAQTQAGHPPEPKDDRRG
ncbi:ATP synthase protein I [Gemmobacter aquatilis]|uniref:ATP synthase protein I n=1 Tax=Gemmobacter aquatilis TaxID=933059 RepID=A0A1H7ZA68_9RHOB|nr:AtpZ/AtpI family protein [Gemmobacter aquatilis]SEM55111.1 ATP synthase protein I [Gemmobacter aquatilis]